MDQKILNALNTLQEAVAIIQTDMVTVKADMVTKKEAKKFVTKADLNKLRSDISNDLGGIVNELVSELDNKKADKVEVEYIEERVKTIEQKIAS